VVFNLRYITSQIQQQIYYYYLDGSCDVGTGCAKPSCRSRRSGSRSSVHGTIEFALAPVRNQVLIVTPLLGVVSEVRVIRIRRTETNTIVVIIQDVQINMLLLNSIQTTLWSGPFEVGILV